MKINAPGLDGGKKRKDNAPQVPMNQSINQSINQSKKRTRIGSNQPVEGSTSRVAYSVMPDGFPATSGPFRVAA